VNWIWFQANAAVITPIGVLKDATEFIGSEDAKAGETTMAIREQLRSAEAWALLPHDKLDERDSRVLADVALGAPSIQAATFLVGHVERYAEPSGTLYRQVHFIVRHGEKDAAEMLTATASFSDELGHEMEPRRSKLKTWMSREMLISEAKCLRLS